MQGTERFGITISLTTLIVQLEGPFFKSNVQMTRHKKYHHKKNKLLIPEETVLVLKGGSSAFTRATPTPSTRYRRDRESIAAI